MTRLILPAFWLTFCLYIGGNVMVSATQITKTNLDRIAVTMCETTGDCQ